MKVDEEFYDGCVTMQLLDIMWQVLKKLETLHSCIWLAWVHVLWLHWSKPIEVCVFGRRRSFILHWLNFVQLMKE